jgi:hypothetical protein
MDITAITDAAVTAMGAAVTIATVDTVTMVADAIMGITAMADTDIMHAAATDMAVTAIMGIAITGMARDIMVSATTVTAVATATTATRDMVTRAMATVTAVMDTTVMATNRPNGGKVRMVTTAGDVRKGRLPGLAARENIATVLRAPARRVSARVVRRLGLASLTSDKPKGARMIDVANHAMALASMPWSASSMRWSTR